MYVNPAAIVLILFCVAIGALFSNPWAGLAVGCGISLLATILK